MQISNCTIVGFQSSQQSTFVLALVTENSIEFLVRYFHTNYLKDLDKAKQSKTAKKCFNFTIEYLPAILFVWQSKN